MAAKSSRGIGDTSTAKLRQESLKMEERLQMLREIMNVEKANRETMRGVRWQSSEKVPSNAKTVPNAIDTSAKGSLRVKILSNQVLEKDKVEVTFCGQCENTKASLKCVECSENYCTVCFAKFHQKGALSKHHAKPLTRKSLKEVTVCDSSSKDAAVSNSSGSRRSQFAQQGNDISTHSSSSTQCQAAHGSLMDGVYDEEASAASFQEALMEWRARGKQHSHQEQAINTTTPRDGTCNTGVSCGMQTTAKAISETHFSKAAIDISFSKEKAVSYQERLMMRKHRVDPKFLKNVTARSLEVRESESSRGEEPKDSSDDEFATEELEKVPSQYNIFYDSENFFQDTNKNLLTSAVHPSSKEVEYQYTVDRGESPPKVIAEGNTEGHELKESDGILKQNSMDQARVVVTQPIPEHSSKLSNLLPKYDQSQHESSQEPKPDNCASRPDTCKSLSEALELDSQQDASITCSKLQLSEGDMKAYVQNMWKKTSSGNKEELLSGFFLSGGVQREETAESDSQQLPRAGTRVELAQEGGGVCGMPTRPVIWMPTSSLPKQQQQSPSEPLSSSPPVSLSPSRVTSHPSSPLPAQPSPAQPPTSSSPVAPAHLPLPPSPSPSPVHPPSTSCSPAAPTHLPSPSPVHPPSTSCSPAPTHSPIPPSPAQPTSSPVAPAHPPLPPSTQPLSSPSLSSPAHPPISPAQSQCPPPSNPPPPPSPSHPLSPPPPPSPSNPLSPPPPPSPSNPLTPPPPPSSQAQLTPAPVQLAAVEQKRETRTRAESSSSDDGGSELCDSLSREDVIENGTAADRDDREALESLAWELASMTDGRLTACDSSGNCSSGSANGSEHNITEGTHTPTAEDEDEDEAKASGEDGLVMVKGAGAEGLFQPSSSSLDKLMGDFEEYQQKIINQESEAEL